MLILFSVGEIRHIPNEAMLCKDSWTGAKKRQQFQLGVPSYGVNHILGHLAIR